MWTRKRRIANMSCRIQFRRATTESVRISILDKTRTAQDGTPPEVVTYPAAPLDPRQLGNYVKDAEKRMNLANNRSFSRNTLRVQISGPEHQPLTLVDLPGIIESDSQNKDNIALIKSIVDEWIGEKRSIILVVVDAGTDAQVQGILTRAKEIDPLGERTFGIITKPDLAGRGSQNEKYWIEHAQNLPHGRVEFNFRKGWHVVLNRNFKDMEAQTTIDQRDMKERKFFQDPNENWHVVDPAYWGIETLRGRLRTLLFEHTKRQLPQVRSDITNKIESYQSQLEAMEERLQQPEKMWERFTRESKALMKLVTAGVDGKYNHPFFANYKEKESARHLRSRIEEENEVFQQQLIHGKKGINLPSEDGTLPADNDTLIEEVKEMISNTRGKELPGHVDPQRLDLLFWNHSEHWQSMAVAHVDRAYRHCMSFIECIVNNRLVDKVPGLPQPVCDRILLELRKSMKNLKDTAREELEHLERDREGAAKTRNYSYIARSRRKRSENLHRILSRVLHAESTSPPDASGRKPLATPSYIAKVAGDENLDSDPEMIATNMLIYHTIARDVFVDNVIVQVIERHLLTDMDLLFCGDFGIKQSGFYEMLQDDDWKAREIERKALEEKVKSLESCLNALQ